jgi:CrcB protein
MKMILAVAAGGAVGAVARYLVMSGVGAAFGGGFPYGTLTVNVFGSFVLGVIVELGALVWSPGEALRAFLVVGILGAFTTFSTFSLDVAVLYERGAFASLATYIILSVAVSVAALFAGLAVVRAIAA